MSKQETSLMPSLSAFSMAPFVSEPTATLFAQHAERREGFDHALRIWLPYEAPLVDFGKDEQKTREFLCSSERKVSSHHRSGMARVARPSPHSI